MKSLSLCLYMLMSLIVFGSDASKGKRSKNRKAHKAQSHGDDSQSSTGINATSSLRSLAEEIQHKEQKVQNSIRKQQQLQRQLGSHFPATMLGMQSPLDASIMGLMHNCRQACILNDQIAEQSQRVHQVQESVMKTEQSLRETQAEYGDATSLIQKTKQEISAATHQVAQLERMKRNIEKLQDVCTRKDKLLKASNPKHYHAFINLIDKLGMDIQFDSAVGSHCVMSIPALPQRKITVAMSTEGRHLKHLVEDVLDALQEQFTHHDVINVHDMAETVREARKELQDAQQSLGKEQEVRQLILADIEQKQQQIDNKNRLLDSLLRKKNELELDALDSVFQMNQMADNVLEIQCETLVLRHVFFKEYQDLTPLELGGEFSRLVLMMRQTPSVMKKEYREVMRNNDIQQLPMQFVHATKMDCVQETFSNLLEGQNEWKYSTEKGNSVLFTASEYDETIAFFREGWDKIVDALRTATRMQTTPADAEILHTLVVIKRYSYEVWLRLSELYGLGSDGVSKSLLHKYELIRTRLLSNKCASSTSQRPARSIDIKRLINLPVDKIVGSNHTQMTHDDAFKTAMIDFLFDKVLRL